MKVSVIVCTYSSTRIHDLMELLESLRKQTYRNTETIVVVDGSERLRDEIATRIDSIGVRNIRMLCNGKNQGLAFSRNVGREAATGDIVAFIDDDAVAEKNWILNLAKTYAQTDAVCVGGKLLPIWLTPKPDYITDELYWILGLHTDLHDKKIEDFRNPYGGNMSFRKDTFNGLLFNLTLGREGVGQIQAEETELAIRILKKYGDRIAYNPEAIVYHKVFRERVMLGYLIRRAFWQGYSKSFVRSVHGTEYLSVEYRYLWRILANFYPHSIRNLASSPVRTFRKVLGVTMVVCSVGLGYLFFLTRQWKVLDQRKP